jgi:tetratricopeptide (TPR) repeat protein
VGDGTVWFMTAALIGRDHPAGMLRAQIARAAESHGGLVLVTGEAGIGKTTLVTGAAEEAARRGALVLSGVCWESDNAPGYWPWVQVVRGLRRSATEAEWAHVPADANVALSVLLGEASGADAATDGFPLYDAVTTALVSVSQGRPVVVVLDDLHWADTASLKLLEFAAQHTWFERVLLIGTYRDAEVEAADHPLRPLVLPLLAKSTTVTLTGLGLAEVGALIARTTGEEPDDELVAEVHLRTGGNPFFVEQTARLWRSGGSLSAIAPGVRDALNRRLALLPPPVSQLLAVAAVLGREFHRQVIAAAAGVPVPEADRLLEQAVTARLVVARGGGLFAFAHDLVRETLYGSLDDAQVRQRHAAVVQAIDNSPALAQRVIPADQARHAYLAGGEIPADRSADLLVAAARDAEVRMAIDEAIGHRRRALERVESPAMRVRIALDLAGNLQHDGESDEAWRHMVDAAKTALAYGDPEVLARAALSVHRVGEFGYNDLLGTGQPELADEMIRAAHRALSDADSAPSDTAPLDKLVRELIVRTEQLARRGADDDALAFALWAQHDTLWGRGRAREREALTTEMIAVTQRSGDVDSELFAASLLWVALVESGDPRYLDQVQTFVKSVERADLPRWHLAGAVDQGIIATFQGRFADAERHYAQAFVNDHRDFMYMRRHLEWALLILQGRHDEADDRFGAMSEREHPQGRLVTALTAIERGDVHAARQHVDAIDASGFTYPSSVEWLWFRLLAQVAAATRDPALCERVRREIGPHTGDWSVSMWGCDLSGPVDLYLGLVDAAQERWDTAVERLTAARESAQRLKARPWVVLSTVELAKALLRRGEADTAEELLAEAAAEADAIGMGHIPERIARVRAGEFTGTPVAADAGGAGEFRRDGAVWRLGYAGRTAHLPDAKGLHDLHLLLGQPGVDVAAVELLNPSGGPAVVAASRMGGDAVLDDVAKAQYKRRLATLDDEIDAAVTRGDDDRAAALDRERQALLDELRAAAGLAGRDRRLGDEAERARKTVTARIRDVLRRLDPLHPELAAHLRSAVSTGAACRYQPDHPTTWRL